MIVSKRLHGSVQEAAWLCASGCMVVCKWQYISVQAAECLYAVIRRYGVECASSYVVSGVQEAMWLGGWPIRF